MYKNNVLEVIEEGSPNRQAHIRWEATEAEAETETEQNYEKEV